MYIHIYLVCSLYIRHIHDAHNLCFIRSLHFACFHLLYSFFSLSVRCLHVFYIVCLLACVCVCVISSFYSLTIYSFWLHSFVILLVFFLVFFTLFVFYLLRIPSWSHCAAIPSGWAPYRATAVAHANVSQSNMVSMWHPDDGIQHPNPWQRTCVLCTFSLAHRLPRIRC